MNLDPQLDDMLPVLPSSVVMSSCSQRCEGVGVWKSCNITRKLPQRNKIVSKYYQEATYR